MSVILVFKAQNFQILDVVRIKPDGNLVVIKGMNAQGKTAVLNGVWAVFAGKSVVPVNPIREGQEQAILQAEIGMKGEKPQYIATRTFKRVRDEQKNDTGTYTMAIKVTDGEGLPYTRSLETLLKSLAGPLSFDPLVFHQKSDAEQFEMLAKLYIPGVDLELIQRQHDFDFDKRADVNKRHTEAKALADAMVVPDEPPGQYEDVDSLTEELRTVEEHNDVIRQKQANRDAKQVQATNLLKDRDRLRNEGDVLEQQIAEQQRQLENKRTMAAAKQAAANTISSQLAALAKLPPLKKSDDVARRLSEANTHNGNIDQWKRDHALKLQREANAKTLRLEAGALTARMAKRQADKNAAIAKAKIPVPGLEFGDKKTLLLNGQPLPQGSTAQRLILAVRIAMAAEPELKIIRIMNLNALDPESLRLIDELAESEGYQIWGEWVGEDGPTGFILEDGHLKDAPKKLAQEKKA